MRPWQHAKASALRGGRDWQDDLVVHELIDVTKTSLADLRHRMVLHNDDLGPEIAARAFPAMADAREIARMHSREDLGAEVPVRVWIELLDPAKLPRVRTLNFDLLLEEQQQRARLRDYDAPRAVLDFLRLPSRYAPDEPARAWCMLAHSAGLGLVRRVLGPPSMQPGVGGSDVVFDPGLCAESMIHRVFRRIPDLSEIASALAPSYQAVLDSLVQPRVSRANA